MPCPGSALSSPPSVPPRPNGLGDLVAARPSTAPASPRTASPLDGDAPAVQPQPAPGAREARPGVAFVIRSNTNLRAEPSSGGAVLRVVRPGTRFRVFGEGPSGCYQVGAAVLEGWI